MLLPYINFHKRGMEDWTLQELLCAGRVWLIVEMQESMT